MASLGQRFDATQHDTEQRDFEELPTGIFRMEIEASDIVPTKAGDGTLLKATMIVIMPEAYKGRKLFTNFNLENKSAQAQDIGQKQFAALCRAVDLNSVEDSEELHFKAFTAKIGLGKAQNGYPARAEIKRYYFPDEGQVPEPMIDANQTAPSAKPANDNKPAAQPAGQGAAATGQRRPWGSK
jgi:hypothetical protein